MLQNVLAGLHDARRDDFEEKTLNQSYRFASYKQFSWWLLGKEIEEWYNLVFCGAYQICFQNLIINVLYTEGKKD